MRLSVMLQRDKYFVEAALPYDTEVALPQGGFRALVDVQDSATIPAGAAPFTGSVQNVYKTLSGGQQHMLVLAQAIVSEPRYILADELSFGLAPMIVARLVPVLEAFAAKGIGVLLIEQFTHIALRISNHAYVMERGRIRFSAEPDALRQNPDILHSAYLAG
jgi:ABC-type branched-subunit amino acid transport system ATPase component